MFPYTCNLCPHFTHIMRLLHKMNKVANKQYTNSTLNEQSKTITNIVYEASNKQEIQLEIIQVIMQLVNTVLDQSYFCHDHQYNKQDEGLSTGTPAPSILSEIYLRTRKLTKHDTT